MELILLLQELQQENTSETTFVAAAVPDDFTALVGVHRAAEDGRR